jgi:beta-N-acetylhexosaminidase
MALDIGPRPGRKPRGAVPRAPDVCRAPLIVRGALAAGQLLAALALLLCALDWRSPALTGFRTWLFGGLIVASMLLFASAVWSYRWSRGRSSALGMVAWTTGATALLALLATLLVEARFRWTRHAVLKADAPLVEMLGHHLLVGYRDVREVEALVRQRAVGGVFVSGRNVAGKPLAEIKAEIAGLQEIRRKQGLPSLWVATDQEGGVVSRLSPPLRKLPPLAEIAARHRDAEAQRSAVRDFAGTQGRELADLGVNLNFAPVIDLNHRLVNPNDRYTRIHQRAISGDPEIVRSVAEQYCATLGDAGVRCTIKHFPGLGRVFEDTHVQSGRLTATARELEQSDWLPFRLLMARERAFTMVSHAVLDAVDRNRPASFSRGVIGGLLRGSWGYEGVLVTDDFSMWPVHRHPGGVGEAAIAALNSGVDLILMAYDSDQYYEVMHALLAAAREGRLDQAAMQRSRSRLAKAAGR